MGSESIPSGKFCNGRQHEDASYDSDDNSTKQTHKNAENSIFMSPAPKAISKQKGNRLKIRSRSPSPFTSTPSKSKTYLQSDHNNSLNTTPSTLNNSTNTAPG